MKSHKELIIISTHLVCRFPLRDARVISDRLKSATIEYPYHMNNKGGKIRGCHVLYFAIKTTVRLPASFNTIAPFCMWHQQRMRSTMK